MIYFSRHPGNYGTLFDEHMKRHIEVCFIDSVVTPHKSKFRHLELMFDLLYEVDAGVFLVDDMVNMNIDSYRQFECMMALGKPVYVMNVRGQINRAVKRKDNEHSQSTEASVQTSLLQDREADISLHREGEESGEGSSWD